MLPGNWKQIIEKRMEEAFTGYNEGKNKIAIDDTQIGIEWCVKQIEEMQMPWVKLKGKKLNYGTEYDEAVVAVRLLLACVKSNAFDSKNAIDFANEVIEKYERR